MLTAQAAANLQTILITQHDIKKDQVNPARIQMLLRLGGCGRRQGDRPIALEVLRHHFAHLDVIIHNKNSGNRHLMPPMGLWLLYHMVGQDMQ